MSAPKSVPPGIILTDRTTIETDWECGRKRWWYKEFGGTGIVPTDEADYFKWGKEIHNDNEELAATGQVDPILAKILEEAGDISQRPAYELEPIWRRMGWIAAYAEYVEPKLQEEFEDVLVEGELVLDRSPLWINVIPDRVQRFRSGPNKGRLLYREYKTTKFVNQGWLDYWPHAIQLHLGIKAIEEELQEPIAYAVVEARLKGDVSYGRLNHPYVWAKVNDKGEWFPAYETKAPLTYMPIWQYEGGVREWVKRCGEETAIKQFAQSRPIFCDARLVEEVVKARLQREETIREWRSDGELGNFSSLFEMHTTKCSPVIGSKCPYLDACFNMAVGDDPIASGRYRTRVPHHELELISWEE